jgi:hypothetical protein
MTARQSQIAIVACAGLLLFIAGAWPQYTIPACIVAMIVIVFALRRMRPGTAAAPLPRNRIRRIAAIAIALGLLFWALLSLRRG